MRNPMIFFMAILWMSAGASAQAWWEPAPGLTWQWQLTGRIDTSVDADVFDIDGFDASKSVVNKLHAQGKKVICYISAGSWEDWRPDADQFPASVLGRNNGWPGEKWLDIRQRSILMPIMRKRMRMCKRKGFDAVEPDNIDGYANRTGFPLTATDQKRYNKALARAAHKLGLAIGLKNDVEQAKALEPYFDFAINEECFEWDECEALFPFIRHGKAVFHAEYALSLDRFCRKADTLGFSSIRKRLDLGAWVQFCADF